MGSEENKIVDTSKTAAIDTIDSRLTLEWQPESYVHVFWKKHTGKTVKEILDTKIIFKQENTTQDTTLGKIIQSIGGKLQIEEQQGRKTVQVPVNLDAPLDAFQNTILTLAIKQT